MSKQFDRHNLAARLEKLGDHLMTAIEKGEAIKNRIDVCNQIKPSAVSSSCSSLENRGPWF